MGCRNVWDTDTATGYGAVEDMCPFMLFVYVRNIKENGKGQRFILPRPPTYASGPHDYSPTLATLWSCPVWRHSPHELCATGFVEVSSSLGIITQEVRAIGGRAAQIDGAEEEVGSPLSEIESCI